MCTTARCWLDELNDLGTSGAEPSMVTTENERVIQAKKDEHEIASRTDLRM